MITKSAMAAQYTEVALEEIEKLLKRRFRMMRPKQDIVRGEIIYDLKLGKFVGVRVWSSVHRGQSTGAGVGADAIRVGLISLKDKGPLEGGKLPIVKRTQNWKDSLKDRIEDCIEKYEERDEFWECWAETRSRDCGSATRQRSPEVVAPPERSEEERARDEDGEGDGPIEQPSLKPPVKAPPETRRYDPDRLQGGITDPQIKYLRVLMRGMTPGKWQSSGAAAVTGMPDPPRAPSDVRGLSKSQASKLIDALKNSMGAGARYAAELELELEALEVPSYGRE